MLNKRAIKFTPSFAAWVAPLMVARKVFMRRYHKGNQLRLTAVMNRQIILLIRLNWLKRMARERLPAIWRNLPV